MNKEKVFKNRYSYLSAKVLAEIIAVMLLLFSMAAYPYADQAHADTERRTESAPGSLIEKKTPRLLSVSAASDGFSLTFQRPFPGTGILVSWSEKDGKNGRSLSFGITEDGLFDIRGLKPKTEYAIWYSYAIPIGHGRWLNTGLLWTGRTDAFTEPETDLDPPEPPHDDKEEEPGEDPYPDTEAPENEGRPSGSALSPDAVVSPNSGRADTDDALSPSAEASPVPEKEGAYEAPASGLTGSSGKPSEKVSFPIYKTRVDAAKAVKKALESGETYIAFYQKEDSSPGDDHIAGWSPIEGREVFDYLAGNKKPDLTTDGVWCSRLDEIDYTKSYTVKSGMGFYTYRVKYHVTQADKLSLTKRISDTAKRVTGSASSEKEKAANIASYIRKNIKPVKYGSRSLADSAEGAIKSGYASNAGRALLFKSMCEASGIDAEIMSMSDNYKYSQCLIKAGERYEFFEF